MPEFKTIHTTTGLALIAQAEATGTPINLTHMAVGDGNGNAVTPVASQTNLVRELFRAPINRVFQSPTEPNRFTAELVIPATEGGFVLREVGVFTAYADLFAAIGTTFGAGDGFNTFNLPDLRGEFVRGWDDARGIDGSRAFGSAQGDRMEDHFHGFGQFLSTSGGSLADDAYFTRRNWSGASETLNAQRISGNTQTLDTTNLSGGNAGDLGTSRHVEITANATETRPRNIALLACIKF